MSYMKYDGKSFSQFNQWIIIRSFIQSFIGSFIQSFLQSLIHPIIHSIIQWINQPFIEWLTDSTLLCTAGCQMRCPELSIPHTVCQSFNHLFNPSFVQSVKHSFGLSLSHWVNHLLYTAGYQKRCIRPKDQLLSYSQSVLDSRPLDIQPPQPPAAQKTRRMDTHNQQN